VATKASRVGIIFAVAKARWPPCYQSPDSRAVTDSGEGRRFFDRSPTVRRAASRARSFEAAARALRRTPRTYGSLE
jgi:hypothetical protein